MNYKNLNCFDPTTCVSGKIMRLNRIVSNVFRKYIRPFGLTNSQLSLLFILSKREDLNQKQLAEMSRLEKSSLNRNLNRLIDNGFVTKSFFPIIKITGKGKSLVDEVIPEWRKAMDEIEEIMGEEGKSALDILMRKVSN